MWVGSLALAGIYPFAGYFSKDVILEAAFEQGRWYGEFAWTLGVLAAVMTAFYSGRLLFMTFHGKPRADEETMHHVHESPFVMMLPLGILAAGALLAGYVFHGGFVGSAQEAGHALDLHNLSGTANIWDKEHFWGQSLFVLPADDTVEAAEKAPEWVKILPTFAGLIGLGLAYLFYMVKPELPAKVARAAGPIYRLFYNKWYFDEFYDWLIVQNVWRIGRFFAFTGDKKIIDGLGPDGMAFVSQRLAGRLRLFQTGYVYHYAFVMMIGLIGLVSWFVLRGVH
jgi:NADH-quinone oxidoreductase subunit L